MAVNAFGDVVPPGSAAEERADPGPGAFPPTSGGSFWVLGNTAVGVVVTNAALSKTGCLLVAQSAHDGLARSIEPAHTTVDGDAIVAAALGEVEAHVDEVRLLAARAVVRAVLSTVAGSQRGP
jgi:L-aminopeptidase/D-esterase-like protein